MKFVLQLQQHCWRRTKGVEERGHTSQWEKSLAERELEVSLLVYPRKRVIFHDQFNFFYPKYLIYLGFIHLNSHEINVNLVPKYLCLWSYVLYILFCYNPKFAIWFNTSLDVMALPNGWEHALKPMKKKIGYIYGLVRK